MPALDRTVLIEAVVDRAGSNPFKVYRVDVEAVAAMNFLNLIGIHYRPWEWPGRLCELRMRSQRELASLAKRVVRADRFYDSHQLEIAGHVRKAKAFADYQYLPELHGTPHSITNGLSIATRQLPLGNVN